MRILISFIKNHQQKIALIIGYFLTAVLFYQLGSFVSSDPPDVEIIEPTIDVSQFNNTLIPNTSQSNTQAPTVKGQQTEACQGKIKGNIGSSGKIYHMPGGAFYNRTDAEECFDTEDEAVKAGFRKSKL